MRARLQEAGIKVGNGPRPELLSLPPQVRVSEVFEVAIPGTKVQVIGLVLQIDMQFEAELADERNSHQPDGLIRDTVFANVEPA